jgi:hypothetical protein
MPANVLIAAIVFSCFRKVTIRQTESCVPSVREWDCWQPDSAYLWCPCGLTDCLRSRAPGKDLPRLERFDCGLEPQSPSSRQRTRSGLLANFNAKWKRSASPDNASIQEILYFGGGRTSNKRAVLVCFLATQEGPFVGPAHQEPIIILR